MDKTLSSISRKNIGGANTNTFRSATASSMPASVGSSNIASSAIAGAVGAAVFAAMSKAFAVANIKSAVVSSNITSYPPPIPAWYLKSLKNKISTEATAGNPLSYMASARASKVARESKSTEDFVEVKNKISTEATAGNPLSYMASARASKVTREKFFSHPHPDAGTTKTVASNLSRSRIVKYSEIFGEKIQSELGRPGSYYMSLIPGLDPESFKAMGNTFKRMFSGIKRFLFEPGQMSTKDVFEGRSMSGGRGIGLHNIFGNRTSRHDLSEMMGNPRSPGSGGRMYGGLSGIYETIKQGVGNLFGMGKKGASGLSAVAHSMGLGGMGTIVKDLGKFGPIIAGVIAGFFALRTAVRLLTEGIQHGTETYRNAARTAHSVSTSFGLTSAFAAIGMESPDLSMLQGQFNGKARKFGVPGDEDVVLGAARAGQLGNVQQLLNMSEEFKAAMKDASLNARQMAKVAGGLSNLSVQTSELGREWKTLTSQIAYMLEPAINGVVQCLHLFLEGLNLVVEGMAKYRDVIYSMIPGGTLLSLLSAWTGGKGGQGNFTRISGGGSRDSSTASSLEKMGFVFPFPGAGNTNYQAAIATNTSKTNTLLLQIKTSLDNMNANGSGYTQAFPSLPNYAQ